MSTTQFQMMGLSALEQRLTALAETVSPQAAGKVLFRSMRLAVRPVLDTARALCKKKDGSQDADLAASLRIAVVKPKAGAIVAAAGIAAGTGKIVDETETEDAVITVSRKVRAGWRWHLAEFPTKPHKIGHSAHAMFQKKALHEAIVRATGKGIRRKESQSAKRAVVASATYQAQRTERGHPGTAARPFLAPSFAQHARNMVAIFAGEMDRGILRALRAKKAA